MNAPTGLPTETRIGRVHLKVSDLARSTAFYRDVLGFAVTAHGLPGTFLAAGTYHHHIALNTFEGAGITPPPKGHTGLYHFAILYPDLNALADAVRRLFDCGYPIDYGRDHGRTLSVYLKDPDGNVIELYYDRPRDRWHDERGRLVLKNEPFDVAELLDDSFSLEVVEREAGRELFEQEPGRRKALVGVVVKETLAALSTDRVPRPRS